MQNLIFLGIGVIIGCVVTNNKHKADLLQAQVDELNKNK